MKRIQLVYELASFVRCRIAATLGIGLLALVLVPVSESPAVEILAGANPGVPYGVATIEIPLAIPIVGQPLPPLEVTDAQGRVLYPVGADVRSIAPRPSDQPVPEPGGGRLLGRLGNLLREITSDQEQLEQTVSRRVMFLFHGESPLRVRVQDARRVLGEYEIVPVRDESVRQRQMVQWWTHYVDTANRQIQSAGYPPWVETYLLAMLSGRTGSVLPDWFADAEDSQDELVDTVKLIAGAEEVSKRVFRRAAAGGQALTDVAALPLPPSPTWLTESLPTPPGDAIEPIVEPMATRVPPECFYIRYGSFANYLWFRDLTTEYGGDISRLVTLRGMKDNSSERMESQLNLMTTELSRMLGPSVIEDQAIIGRDLYFTDGASVGVLFKASQPLLLRTSLNNDRAVLAKKDPSVTLSDETIAGKTVSFLRSPDNRVRSYMVEDGAFFLVTNSRTIAERFIEVGAGEPSLAATKSFQLARRLMPVDRDDSVFAYFSPEMLQGLVSPQSLIELRRRMYAKADIALVHLARYAATSEGIAAESPDELVDAGFLPNGFGQRNDGSGVIAFGSQVIDSSRGARGTFLPIADVTIDSVTREEASWYEQIASSYSARFPRMDPIMIGIQRTSIDGSPGLEQLSIHAEVAPWEPLKYGKLSQQLGPPTPVAMKFAPDDIVAVQAHVASETLGPPTHLFAAIKDTRPPDPESFDGIIKSFFAVRTIPGYLGAWPQPGALDRLPLGLGRGQPVGPGMSRLIGGVYRYTGGGFSIVSFFPDVLQSSLPHIAAIDVPDTAQVRARIGNLVGSQLEGWVNSQLYTRAAETSRAGANFLTDLTRQMKVPPSDALDAAERVLGAPLQCSLGGEYIYDEESHAWTSTAVRNDLAIGQMPPDYVAPFMVWFRGMEASLTQYSDRLVADAIVNMARGTAKP